MHPGDLPYEGHGAQVQVSAGRSSCLTAWGLRGRESSESEADSEEREPSSKKVWRLVVRS